MRAFRWLSAITGEPIPTPAAEEEPEIPDPPMPEWLNLAGPKVRHTAGGPDMTVVGAYLRSETNGRKFWKSWTRWWSEERKEFEAQEFYVYELVAINQPKEIYVACPFTIGQQVQLKSGGPAMVVDQIKDKGEFYFLATQWFDGAEIKSARFDHRVLMPVMAPKVAEYQPPENGA